MQPGDTLSGIAAALGIPGGWPALYAANRQVIGPDPGLIRPGTVLALPGRASPDPLPVGAGDTLSGIAAALGTPGGWPALYAANRRMIGPDPDAIRTGTVLAIPYAASPVSHPRRLHRIRRRRQQGHQHRGSLRYGQQRPPVGPASASARPPDRLSTGIGPAVEAD